jgi:hypothetical protein
MTASDVARYGKRCAEVMQNPGSYDRALQDLCTAIAGATR